MINSMNILAIGAHPDDIEYGCAGTLIKYAERDHRILLMILTGGEEGGNGEERKREQSAAADIIGAQQVFWGGYRDTQLPLNKELIDKIEEVLVEVEPDLIMVNYGDDTHQDHRILTEATMSATRYVRNVLFFEGPTTQNFNPQVFVDVSDTLERKFQALKSHESQVMKTNIENMSIVELARANATFRGIQGRVKFAEAFAPLRLFINI
ncbi:MAG: PIG-L family deacetylase [Deltaproteobacteria bacterium]|jgi:LmbE family N-acetylglucosaminyl deacetylase